MLFLVYVSFVSFTVLLSNQLHTLDKACFLSKDPECRVGTGRDPNTINTLNHGSDSPGPTSSSIPSGSAPGSSQPPVPSDPTLSPSENYTEGSFAI